MKCSPSMMKYTGYLHILALAVVYIYHQGATTNHFLILCTYCYVIITCS